MNNNSDFTDTPAYPQGVGEFDDHILPNQPRPVEWWGNAKTGFSEPMVVIYNRRGRLNEVVYKTPARPSSSPVGWLAVVLFILSISLLVGWIVWSIK